MPDENDIIYSTYQLDIKGILRWLYEHTIGLDADFDAWYQTLVQAWYVFSILAFTISALLLMGIVYAFIRFKQMSEIESDQLREAERQYKTSYGSRDENSKWQRILGLSSTESPNDWRLAIIEADIILDELLDSLGYVGTSIGDKLKSANPDAFQSLEDAWDAHKVRNNIAHRGSDFVLTKHITQNTIAQYQRVFEEFNFV